MTQIFYDRDADPAALERKTVAIIGYGSQGHAHALNLKDSGVSVVVGLAPHSRRWNKVTEDGLEVMEVDRATRAGDVVMILVPDEVQGHYIRTRSDPLLSRARRWRSPMDSTSISGRSNRPRTRMCLWSRLKGRDILFVACIRQASEYQHCWPFTKMPRASAARLGLAYARALGSTKAGLIETTFAEETETDLFGEQACTLRRRNRAHSSRFRNSCRGRISARNSLFRVPS